MTIASENSTSSKSKNLPADTAGMRRLVWQLAWPVILANTTIPLVGLTDTAVMGHLGEVYDIGAVSLGSLVFSLVFISLGFLRMATTGLVAQAAGRGEQQAMLTHLLRSLGLAMLIGLAIILLRQPLIWLAGLLLGASMAVEAGMADYLGIVFLAAPAALANMALLGYLYGIQSVRVAVLQLVLVNGFNITGNLLLVIGFGMGVKGVALATALAQWGGLAISLLLVRAAIGPLGRLDWPAWNQLAAAAPLLRLVRLGRDIIIRTSCILLAEAVVLAQAAELGDAALAASQVLLVLFGLIAYSLDGFAHAAEIMTGTAIGAGKSRGLRLVIHETTRLAAVMAAVLALLMLLFYQPVVGLITSQQVVRQAAGGLQWVMVLMPAVGVWAFQLDGIFIGATRGRVMRNAMLLSMAGFLLASGVLWQLAAFNPLATDQTEELAAQGLSWQQAITGLDAIWAAFLLFLGLRGLTLLYWLDSIYATIPQGRSVAGKDTGRDSQPGG